MNNVNVIDRRSLRVFWLIGSQKYGYTYCIGTEHEAEAFRTRRRIDVIQETKKQVRYEDIPGETEILDLRLT